MKKGLEKQRQEARMQGEFGSQPPEPIAQEPPGCSAPKPLSERA